MGDGIGQRLRQRMHRYFDPHDFLLREAVLGFANTLAEGSRILDAGAGQCQYKPLFSHCQYTAADLGVGDDNWDYSNLDIRCDLEHIPRDDGAFDACICVVVLEHVSDPTAVCRELFRVLRPGGRLFAAIPFSIQEHQMPHDYFRYTSQGVRHLLVQAGFGEIELLPWGHDKLTIATQMGRYFLSENPGPLPRLANKVLVASWTALKAYYLHHPQAKPELPFGWFAQATR